MIITRNPNQSKINFQWYDGNIKHAIPKGFLTVEDFIKAHRYPSKKLVSIFEQINKAEIEGNKKLKAGLKQENLFYFTPSAIFNGRRQYENIDMFTGLAQLDFDKVTDSVSLKQYLFETYKEIICCYLSPSGRGVKALIRIKKAENIHEYRKLYAGLAEEFSEIDGFDSAPKNAALPLFLSIDEDILDRDDFTIWTKEGKVMKQSDYKNLNLEPPDIKFSDDGYKSKGYYERITIDIFKKKLSEIIDSDGHPRLRSACLIFGSRIGAGYLDIQTGRAIAEFEVKSHQYFQKDIKNYLKTVEWALKQGALNPRHYS